MQCGLLDKKRKGKKKEKDWDKPEVISYIS